MTSDNYVFMGMVGISFLAAIAVGISHITYLAGTGRSPSFKHFVATLVLMLGVFLLGAAIGWVVDPPHPAPQREVRICQGPLVWFDADDGEGGNAAILECAACPYIVVTGNVHDAAHQHTPLMREGLAH